MAVELKKFRDLPKLTDSMLADMERASALHVPKELRRYLMRANGFRTVPNHIPSPIGRYYVDVPFIAGVDASGFEPSESADERSISYLRWVYGACLPSTCIPIGYVGEANLLVAWYRGPRKGKIGFKKYDEDRLAEPGYRSKDLKVLADDFDSFVSLLSEDLTEY